MDSRQTHPRPSPITSKLLTVNKATGEVNAEGLTDDQRAKLNTEALKAARRAAIFSAEHPEEFAKTMKKDAARLEFERKELEAITTKSGTSLEGIDPERAAKMRLLLAEVAKRVIGKSPWPE